MRSIFSSAKHEERLDRERIAAATWKPPGRTRKEEVGWKCKQVLRKDGAEMQRPPPKTQVGWKRKDGVEVQSGAEVQRWGGNAKGRQKPSLSCQIY